MALPEGFNPKKMTFDTKPVIHIPQNTSYIPYRSYDSNGFLDAWDTFNGFIVDIGNWFADHAEGTLGLVGILYTLALAVIGIGGTIATWVDQGFWSALIVGVIAWFVCLFLWKVGLFVIVIVVNVVMYGFRWIFWNGWTLLLSIAGGVGLWLWLK